MKQKQAILLTKKIRSQTWTSDYMEGVARLEKLLELEHMVIGYVSNLKPDENRCTCPAKVNVADIGHLVGCPER